MAMFVKTTYSSGQNITAHKWYFMNEDQIILNDIGERIIIRNVGKICSHLDGKGRWEKIKQGR